MHCKKVRWEEKASRDKARERNVFYGVRPQMRLRSGNPACRLVPGGQAGCDYGSTKQVYHFPVPQVVHFGKCRTFVLSACSSKLSQMPG